MMLSARTLFNLIMTISENHVLINHPSPSSQITATIIFTRFYYIQKRNIDINSNIQLPVLSFPSNSPSQHPLVSMIFSTHFAWMPESNNINYNSVCRLAHRIKAKKKKRKKKWEKKKKKTQQWNEMEAP